MLRVSVIIPNFNRASLVVETIHNMLRQTLRPVEVIVVDDGSTDDSVARITAIGGDVRLICQKNQGPGAARNAGLEIATGDYVQFMDNDDLGSLNKLQVQAELLEREQADIAFSPWMRGSVDFDVFAMRDPVLQQKLPPSSRSILDWFMSGWSTVFQTLLFRTDFVRRTGQFRSDMMTAEDSELFVRMLLQKPKLAFSDHCLTLYRLHAQHKLTETGASSAARAVNWAKFLHYSVTACKNAGHAFPGSTRWAIRGMIDESYRRFEKLKLQEEAVHWLDPLAADGWRKGRLILPSLALSRRVASSVRVRTAGTTWMRAYQFSSPTAHQRALVEQMGFKLREFRADQD